MQTMLAIRDGNSYERVAKLQEVMLAIRAAKAERRATEESRKWGGTAGLSTRRIQNLCPVWERLYETEGAEAALMVLADGRREMAKCPRRNPWFDVYLKYIENDRNTDKGGWDTMMRDFRSGQLVIPELGGWKEVWQREHEFESLECLYDARVGDYVCPVHTDWTPVGATYQNLQMLKRKYEADYRANVAFNRLGRKALQRHLLPVLLTRVGVMVGEITQFDDVMLNDDIIVNGEICRPMAFTGYDYASANQVARAMKPRVKSAAGTWKNLNEYEFRCTLAFHMLVTGFRLERWRGILEHGTTAIRDTKEDKLRTRILTAAAAHGFNIEFAESGILSEQAHAGLFKGVGGGNFHFKGLCEGSHNIVHNALASLPGSRGRDADHLHESEQALVKYEQWLLDCARKIDPIVAAKIVHGLETFEEYEQSYNVLANEVMRRTDHKLEGWGDNMVQEILVAGEWVKMDDFVGDSSPAEVALAGALARKNPGMVRMRQKSRLEVWDDGVKAAKLAGKWATFPMIDLPLFFTHTPRQGRRFGDFAEVTVRDNGLVGVRDAFYFGRDELLFHASIKTARGYMTNLMPGKKVRVLVNPLMPHVAAFVSPEDGRTLGIGERYDRAPAYDRHAIEIAMGKQAHDLAKKVLPMRGRHQEEAEERAGRMAFNATLIGDAKRGVNGGVNPSFGGGGEAVDIETLAGDGADGDAEASGATASDAADFLEEISRV